MKDWTSTDEKYGPFALHIVAQFVGVEEADDGFTYEWRFGDGDPARALVSEHRYPTKAEAEDAARSYLLVLLLRMTTELAERVNRVWHSGEGYP